MRSQKLEVLLASIALAIIFNWSPARLSGAAPEDLPAKLTDQEFWQLINDLSEPEGTFPSDNLTSNEGLTPVSALVVNPKPGRAYLGVGPEQNFSYIAAAKPAMAFVVDIRRGNLHLHLMYKALFELSADRADFVSRLFTKPRPAGLTGASTVADIFNTYWTVATDDETAYAANLRAIQHHLTTAHALPLSPADLDGVARIFRAFYWYGPRINYGATNNFAAVSVPGGTYRDLMTQTDRSGAGLSYLSSEEKFAFVRELHVKNLIVPVVGNFAGPRALRAVGTYVRQHGGTVGVFYTSNVETLLLRDAGWSVFCANVASMPLDESSVLIRPFGSIYLEGGTGVVSMWAAVKACR